MGLGFVLAWTLVAGASASAATPPGPQNRAYGAWSSMHQQLAAMVPPARPADVASPEAIVATLHASISGPQGPWNSDRLRSLCLPNVVQVEVAPNEQGALAITNHPLDTFVQEVQQVHDTTGWYEYVTKVVNEQTQPRGGGGALAVIDYSGYVSTTPHGKPIQTGTSQASLVYDGARWWVAADTW